MILTVPEYTVVIVDIPIIGYEFCKLAYIAFLDDDDEWFPKKLSMQVSILDNSPLKVGVVYTGSIAVDITIGYPPTTALWDEANGLHPDQFEAVLCDLKLPSNFPRSERRGNPAIGVFYVDELIAKGLGFALQIIALR